MQQEDENSDEMLDTIANQLLDMNKFLKEWKICQSDEVLGVIKNIEQ